MSSSESGLDSSGEECYSMAIIRQLTSLAVTFYQPRYRATQKANDFE